MRSLCRKDDDFDFVVASSEIEGVVQLVEHLRCLGIATVRAVQDDPGDVRRRNAVGDCLEICCSLNAFDHWTLSSVRG